MRQQQQQMVASAPPAELMLPIARSFVASSLLITTNSTTSTVLASLRRDQQHQRSTATLTSFVVTAMATTIVLQPAHAFLPLLLVGTTFVNVWAAFKVGAARKKYDIAYPQVRSFTLPDCLHQAADCLKQLRA